MNIDKLITEYLMDKELAWAETTLKTEEFRIKSVASKITGNPSVLWRALQTLAPYSRVTSWTRITDFYQWCMEHRHVHSAVNPYREWRKKNARLFKHAYERSVPSITIEDARRRVAQIADVEVRNYAEMLLRSGLRAREVKSLRNGRVVGKGGKSREVFGTGEAPRASYARVYRALKKVGLKPHDLRKIFLNACVEQGADVFDLMELAGWSSPMTATSYIKARAERVRGIAEKVAWGVGNTLKPSGQ